MLLVAPVLEEHRAALVAEEAEMMRTDPDLRRRVNVVALHGAGRHARGLQRPRPDGRRAARPLLPADAGVPRADRLPGHGQHQLQRPRRADRHRHSSRRHRPLVASGNQRSSRPIFVGWMRVARPIGIVVSERVADASFLRAVHAGGDGVSADRAGRTGAEAGQWTDNRIGRPAARQQGAVFSTVLRGTMNEEQDFGRIGSSAQRRDIRARALAADQPAEEFTG